MRRIEKPEGWGTYPVPFETWSIGMEFWMSGNHYRVTDVGSRTINAICIDMPFEIVVAGRHGPTRTEMSDDPSWFNGPPYAVVEHVMDEDDLQVCYLEPPSEEEMADFAELAKMSEALEKPDES